MENIGNSVIVFLLLLLFSKHFRLSRLAQVCGSSSSSSYNINSRKLLASLYVWTWGIRIPLYGLQQEQQEQHSVRSRLARQSPKNERSQVQDHFRRYAWAGQLALTLETAGAAAAGPTNNWRKFSCCCVYGDNLPLLALPRDGEAGKASSWRNGGSGKRKSEDGARNSLMGWRAISLWIGRP